MTTIKRVVVAGASGNLGKHILTALHNAGFTLSALTRQTTGSQNDFPSYVTPISTDYTFESLVTAFTGQDAIVSCVGVEGVPQQIIMIDAAEHAGVKRFIPSEFGWSRDLEILPELAARLKVKDEVFEYLVEKCKTSQILTWSAVATGPFLDWSIKVAPSLGFNLAKRTARIAGSGQEPITCSTGETMGKAAAGMLLHADETLNRFLKVRTLKLTQTQCLAALEQVTGTKWDVTRISMTELKESKAKNVAEKQFLAAFLDVLALQLFEDGAGRGLIVPDDNDNDLVGVVEENVVNVMKKVLGSGKASTGGLASANA